MCVHLYICMYICMYLYLYVCVCIFYVCVCIYLCICIYMYIYIYIICVEVYICVHLTIVAPKLKEILFFVWSPFLIRMTLSIFKYDVNHTCWMVSFKIFIDHIKHLIFFEMFTLTSLTMTDEGRKCIYSCILRYFGQLLKNLHPHLQNFNCKWEKTYKNSIPNPCLSSFMK